MAKFISKRDEKKVAAILNDSAYLVRLFQDGLAGVDFRSHSVQDIGILCKVLQKVNRDNIRADPAYTFANFYYVKDGLWFESSWGANRINKWVPVNELYAAFQACGLIDLLTDGGRE